MTHFEWFLNLIGWGGSTPENTEQSTPVVTPENPPGPWDILWGGEIHHLKAAFDNSWGGNEFFARDVEVKGVTLTAMAIKQASANPTVFFMITNRNNLSIVSLEVQGSNTVIQFGPTVSVPTKDVKEALILLAEQGHLQTLFT